MIPKVIHYCWFGKGDLPKSAEYCLQTWKKFCPEYTIKRWDETNFDVYQNKFVKQAYEAKKYAFVSDYARFAILEENGGIYVDTDVEFIKPIDSFLEEEAFMGFEKAKGVLTGVAPGLIIGACAHQTFLKDIKAIYETMEFQNEEGIRTARSVVEYTTEYLKEKGLKMVDQKQKIGEVTIYPASVFCPKDFETGELSVEENTVSIHQYDSTWWSPRALYLKNMKMKYGDRKGIFLYRLARIFNVKLWIDRR